MQIIKTYDDQIMLFKLLVIAGLMYSIPILFEIRMSPQLHTWIYGFFPHSFGQQMRFDGFRAVVFLGHGLIVAMFVAISLGAASILLKLKLRIKILPPWLVVIYFILLLLLSKTVGAFLLGMLLFTMIVWAPLKWIKRLAIVLAVIVVTYPALSILDVFPHEKLVEVATDFDVARGESLNFRFVQENQLLTHAREKIFFGWGSWGRNRLVESTTDGYWIILLGQHGLFGFISMFGLAITSIWRALHSIDFNSKNNNEYRVLIYHALIVTVIMIDQLPNASLSAWLVLLIGALLGRANYARFKYLKK